MRLRGWIMALFLAVLVVGVMGFIDLSDEFRDGGRGGGGRVGGGGGRVGGGGGRVGGGGSRPGGGRHHGGGGRHHGGGYRRGGGYYGGGSSWGWFPTDRTYGAWGWPYWGWSWYPWSDDCTVYGCPDYQTCYVTDSGYSFCA